MKLTRDSILAGLYNKMTRDEFHAATEQLPTTEQDVLNLLSKGLGRYAAAEQLQKTDRRVTDALDTISDAFPDKRLEEIIALAREFGVKPDDAPQEPLKTDLLSPQERKTVENLMTGARRRDVAQDMNISEHTLRVYIDSAQFKLAADSLPHTCAIARSEGMGEDRQYQTVLNISDRQKQAMCGIAQGMDRAELAENLGVTEHTLRTHIDVVSRKLGFHGQGNKSVMLAVAAVDMFGDHAFDPLDQCVENIARAEAEDALAEALEDDTLEGNDASLG